MSLLIPKNQEAEESSLGCLLNGADINTVPLLADHFHGPDHQIVFGVIRELADDNLPIDITTVRARLEAKGLLEKAGGHPARFLKSGAAIGQDAMLAFHFEHLELSRQARKAFLFAHEHMPLVVKGELPAFQFADNLASACAPLSSDDGNSAAEIVAEIELEQADGRKPEVFPTGFAPLDLHLSGGFHRGELAVIGADTGMGKSALLIQSSVECAKSGVPVVYFSLEMNRKDVVKRMACASHRVAQSDAGFSAAACAVAALPITVYDETCDLNEIIAQIRTSVKLHKCQVAVVDYLQIVEFKADSRELVMSEIARKLKNLAQTEGIVLLTASQVNEAGALRESRAIGHHANAVVFIGCDGQVSEDGTMPPQHMVVAKFRRGPRTTIKNVGLHGAHSRFENLSNSPF